MGVKWLASTSVTVWADTGISLNFHKTISHLRLSPINLKTFLYTKLESPLNETRFMSPSSKKEVIGSYVALLEIYKTLTSVQIRTNFDFTSCDKKLHKIQCL
jgi:hypothetical protein